jgi:hypothetical protein
MNRVSELVYLVALKKSGFYNTSLSIVPIGSDWAPAPGSVGQKPVHK